MSATSWRRLRTSLATLLLFALAGGAQGGEAYYLAMFGSQRTPTNPNYSHTWATFVRATWEGDGPCPQNPYIEAHTISWLPQNMIVRIWALHPECGMNFDLHTTIHNAMNNRERISMWGPYEIERELYDLALRQIGELNSGRIRYKANDTFYPSDRVSNCIHAVSSMVGGFRLRVGSPGWGETASYAVLLRLTPWIVGRDETHPWVGTALGLDQYPIIYRDRGRPFSGGIVGPFTRILGHERDLVPSYGPPCR